MRTNSVPVAVTMATFSFSIINHLGKNLILNLIQLIQNLKLLKYVNSYQVLIFWFRLIYRVTFTFGAFLVLSIPKKGRELSVYKTKVIQKLAIRLIFQSERSVTIPTHKSCGPVMKWDTSISGTSLF